MNIGFHEILIHDLEEEELPFVVMSELGCLRMDWPKTLFTFMSRYQFDLDQMRKSRSCTHCGKHIQQNLGKHVALYHMELAQLWQCPVTWCTVWKGTAQDCVDHMRRAHDIPPLVKAANLACWFPPWTVSREQWSSLSRPAVAVDTLLFSRIGVPLFHHYWVVNRTGTHGAFRGSYMRRMHAFLEVTSPSSSMRLGYCSTDVKDIYSGHGGQDARYFFSTQSLSPVGLPGPEAYQADGTGRFIGSQGTGPSSLFGSTDYTSSDGVGSSEFRGSGRRV